MCWTLPWYYLQLAHLAISKNLSVYCLPFVESSSSIDLCYKIVVNTIKMHLNPVEIDRYVRVNSRLSWRSTGRSDACNSLEEPVSRQRRISDQWSAGVALARVPPALFVPSAYHVFGKDGRIYFFALGPWVKWHDDLVKNWTRFASCKKKLDLLTSRNTTFA